MLMWLTKEGQQILSNLIDKRMRELLDWTDFLEDAGVQTYLIDAYLNCTRNDVMEDDLFGFARAMQMSFLDLFCKLKWDIADEEIADELKERETRGPIDDDPTILKVVDALEEWCNECIDTEKMEEFKDPYNKLWDIFDEATSKLLRDLIAPKIADFTYKAGDYYHNKNDFLGLCSQYNASYSFVKDNPEYYEGSLTCVMLAVGVFEKKFTFREFENVESYIDELVPIAERFPDKEEFTLQSAICLCNLLQLCPYDYSVFFSDIIKIVDQLTELSKRFIHNAALQLCYMRSMVFFLCYGKPRLKDEIYEPYETITREAFIANEGLVSKSDYAEMKHSLRENDIYFD